MGQEVERFLTEKSKVGAEPKPLVLDLHKESDQTKLKKLIAENKIQHVADDYEEQLREYFQVQNPAIVYAPNFEDEFQKHLVGLKAEAPLWQQGRWVYFPWISTLAHILEDEAFQLVRTARNRNLITQEEQEKFYNATIGIAGLSVGNSVVLAIVLQGGAKRIKLADHDRLALTNTNRIRSGVDNLGVLKVEMTARQIYLLNPYAEVELYPEGLTKENISNFFEGLDIVVDELDNLAIKYCIREQARKHRIAVVMGADNGDNAVIDVERYDENPAQEFFHNRMGEVTYEGLAGLDKFGIGKKIAQHIGVETVTEAALSSFLQIGKTVVSWPQLGGAALLNGCAIAYCVRKILNKQPLESNRALISMDEMLDPNYNKPEEVQRRSNAAAEFRKVFGL